MESVAFIQWCLEHLNYWTITLLMTIESSFIPFPSEVIIPPAAYKAAVNDELNIYLVVLFATIGADIGALINYYLAKWLGRPIIYKFANSRIGHMCLIDEAKVQHAESYFDKHGALSTFIPFPSEVIIPPAAYKAAVNDELNIYLVVLFATIGADIGALINYYLAKWLGRPIIYKFANSRIGHMCLIDEAKVQHAESYFDKHGALSTFIGRLIPAIRQLISIPAGLARMKMHTFLLYTTIGAGLWNTILAIIGYYLSTVPGIESEEQLIAKVTEYSHEIGYCFIAIGIFIVGFLVYKGMKRNK